MHISRNIQTRETRGFRLNSLSPDLRHSIFQINYKETTLIKKFFLILKLVFFPTFILH